MPVDPSTISGLVGWWKADAITGLSDLDPVTSWPDSSGNGHTATGVDDPVYETNAVNGLPTIHIAGTARFTVADHADLKMDTDSTLFAVVKPDGTDPSAQEATIPFSKGPNSGAGAYYLRNGGTSFPILDRPFVEGGVGGTVPWLAASHQAIVCSVSGTAVSHFVGFSAAGTDTLAVGTPTTDVGRIGAFRSSGAGGAAQGEFRIAELLIYNVALSEANREAVIEYLHDKYAFTPLLAGRAVRIAQVYGEIPGTERAVRIAQAWGQIPEQSRAVLIAQAWGEIPDFERAVRIAMAWGLLPSPQSGLTGGAPGGAGDVVADFERLLPTVYATAFERPRGKSSWSNTGVGQMRASIAAGVTWEETFQPARKTDPVLHAFLEYLNDLAQNERIFEIPLSGITSRPTLLGTATGSITVNGADQTGYSLAISGLSGTLKRGDLIRVAGLNYVMAIQADAAASPLSINPGILPGGSPTSGAVVTYGSTLKIRAKIDQLFQPEVDANQVYIGLRVRFREVP